MNNDVDMTFNVLNEKYGEIVNNDINHLSCYAKWFFYNRISNIELDKKYNLK